MIDNRLRRDHQITLLEEDIAWHRNKYFNGTLRYTNVSIKRLLGEIVDNHGPCGNASFYYVKKICETFIKK